MRISEIIRRANGEKPDFAIDDIGDIGHWQGMNDAALIAETDELVQLNENQQVVLEWLQIYADKDSGDKPFQTIFFLWDCIKSNNLGNDELTALRKLTRAEQFQVLAAFAEWGMKEVAE